MDDPPTLGALFGRSLNLGHHIVVCIFFDSQGAVEVDISDVLLQIGQLGCGNQAGFVLGCSLSHRPGPSTTPVCF